MPNKTLEQIFEERIAFLLEAEKAMSKSVVKIQAQLFELLASEYFVQFEVEDGKVVNNKHNLALISQIDAYFAKVQKAIQRDVLGPFINDLLKGATMNSKYYTAMGFKKQIVDNVLKNKLNLELRLGFTPTGRLRKDGYLYALGQTAEVRQKLKDYVIKSLTGDVPFLDFQLGLRNLVKGNKRTKGLATTGSLERYFDQYAHDKFAELDAVASNQLAANFDLKHFIYEGSVIATSRKFCSKRAGQAFTTKEAKTWKDDADLVDKKTKASYRPLIDRGRYRCRHWLRYITEDLYDALPPNKKGLKTV